ncbi:MAG: phosphoribosylformylglycinamidine synthase subunit PurQ [Candidatus Binatia bacterium]
MRWGIVVFPGSCDDHDVYYCLKNVLKQKAEFLWHKNPLRGHWDCIVLPGGFSYGDYLRTGAMARFSPVMEGVIRFAQQGGFVLGVCNGFQILCEAGLLPGALMRNSCLQFVCRPVCLRLEETDTAFTGLARKGEILRMPIKHGDGSYYAEPDTLEKLRQNRQILLRYVDAEGESCPAANPNGSVNNIAGVCNEGRNVFGLMPHPEQAAEKILGSDDGLKIFSSMIAAREKKGR